MRPISGVLAHQRCMRCTTDELSHMQQVHLIDELSDLRAMRDEDEGRAGAQREQIVHHCELSPRIEVRCGLIEEEDGPGANQESGNGQSLPLAA